MGLDCKFRHSVHCHQSRKHGSVQTNVVPKEPGVLHLDWKAARRRLAPTWLGGESPSLPPQQHTSPSKATPPNSAIPWAEHIHTFTVHYHHGNIQAGTRTVRREAHPDCTQRETLGLAWAFEINSSKATPLNPCNTLT